jgi:hypothetical protein
MATNHDAYGTPRMWVDRELIKIERSACLSTEIESVTDEHTKAIFESGLDWLEDFIMQPHAQLGRRGAVCPFAKPVHNEESLVFCAWDVERLRFEDYLAVSSRLTELYHSLRASTQSSSRLFSLCVFLRGLQDWQFERYIDEAHSQLKPAFMEQGLMIGEFHPLSMTKGVHSSTFLPMRSSQPAFVVRAMSPHDALFIDRDESADEVRLRELLDYRFWLGDALPEADIARIEKRIVELRSAVPSVS